ncbi:MAG: replication initiator protein A, partial [Cetobacterium sp.]
MSKMKINDFKKNEFYQLPKWILKVKGLKPVDMVLYSLAFNNWKLSERNGLVNEEEEIYFFMTHETIKKELEIGKDQVIDSIKRLVKSGVIIQERIVGKATRFYLENNLENIEFETTKSTTENPTSTKKPTSRKSRPDQSVKSDHTSTENPTTDQSENTDINNKDSFKKDYLKKTEVNNNCQSVKVDVENFENSTHKSTADFINKLLHQGLRFSSTENNKMMNWAEECGVDPMSSYRKSSYLRGEKDLKPTKRMFLIANTWEKMALGDYDDKQPKKSKNEPAPFKQTEYSDYDNSFLDEILGG